MEQYPTTTVTIYREHDKICILEKYLNNDCLLETLVSNFIDHCIQKQTYLARDYFNKLKQKMNNENFETIIHLALSIADQTPYIATIEVNDNTTKIIEYLKDTKIQQLY